MVAFSSLKWTSVATVVSLLLPLFIDATTASSVAFAGITTGFTGSRPPQRQDFVTFAKNKEQLNIFYLALARMQAVQESDPESYTQLAKIHGLPIGPWDSVSSPAGANPGSGYCTHIDPLFPLWHRPYMALFEQVLYNNVQAIHQATLAIGDKRYSSIAPNFRMPYWDWAKDQTIPDIIGYHQTTKVHTIVNKKMVEKRIRNPLYSYTTSELAGTGSSQTLRNPVFVNGVMTANPNAGDLNAKLKSLQATNPWSTQYYNAITQNKLYRDFRQSIENTHNDVHNQVGAGGQFTSPAWASFDPIFWLHHTNVDRLIAIWQKLNPTSYIAGDESTSGTYGIPAGPATDQTPLSPFHQAPGKFWTSAAIYNTEALGYVYPETDIPSNVVGQAAIYKYVWSKVNTVYQADYQKALAALHNGSKSKRSSFAMIASNHTLTATNGTRFSNSSTTAPVSGGLTEADLRPYFTSLVNSDGTYNEYVCNVTVNTGALGQSYGVHFFVGAPPTGSDCSQWVAAPSWAGSFAIFSGANMNMTNSGQVPLTNALMKHIVAKNAGLEIVSNANVMLYLKKNLQWAVCTANQTAVASADCPGLAVRVDATNVALPVTTVEMPSWGNSTLLHEPATGWNPAVYDHLTPDTPNSIVASLATTPCATVSVPTSIIIAPTTPVITLTSTYTPVYETSKETPLVSMTPYSYTKPAAATTAPASVPTSYAVPPVSAPTSSAVPASQTTTTAPHATVSVYVGAGEKSVSYQSFMLAVVGLAACLVAA